MNNPFAALDLHLLRIKTMPKEKRIPNLDQQLKLVNVSKPNGVRDRVILLLRHKYKLRPSDISALNISDVDLEGGIIHIFRQPKKRIVVIDECDFLDLRRWSAVRKLYVSGVDAFIISMHWTQGRTEPYKRISVRGVFQVVQKYASSKQLITTFDY
jgi:site-specific recombinase XerC